MPVMDEFANIKIAVDFDGTIVEHAFPAIGKEKLFAFRTLKELEKKGARLILWTFRTGKELEEAVEYCRQNGIEFYAVNKNYPEEIFDDTVSRKIDADIYLDDKNFGGFPGWSQVWQVLNPYEIQEQIAEKRISRLGKNLLRKLFGGNSAENEI
jgi:hydroxymethylpyrimidine pyrophosphatase-like HAD family hydrolase